MSTTQQASQSGQASNQSPRAMLPASETGGAGGIPWTKVYVACRNLIAASNGIQWYDYQRQVAQRIVKAVVNHESTEIAIELSRQSGKSEVVADVCAAMMMLFPELFPESWGDGFKVGFFAPKEELALIIFNRLKDRFSSEVLGVLGLTVHTSNGNTFTLSNGSVARCITANKNSHSEGFTFDLIVCDECQNIDTQILLKSIYPMGTATAASKVLIGTATTTKRYFYDILTRDKETDRVFVLDVDRVMADRRKLYELTRNKWHLNYEKDFLSQLRARGKDDFIRMAYYLEWVLERGMFITDNRLLELALPYDMVRRFPYPSFGGLDLGKESDSTVLTILSEHCPVDLVVQTDEGPVFVKRGDKLWDPYSQRNHQFVLAWIDFVGDRYTEQMPQVCEFLRGFPRLVNLTFDQTGVGKGVEDILWDCARKVVLQPLKADGTNDGPPRPLNEVINAFSFGNSAQLLSDLWEDIMRMMPSRGMAHFPMGKDWVRTQGLNLPSDRMHKETAAYVKQFTDLEKLWRGPMLKCAVEEGGTKHDDYCASHALANWGVMNNASMRLDIVQDGYDPETGEYSDTPLTVDSFFEDEQQSRSWGSGAFYL